MHIIYVGVYHLYIYTSLYVHVICTNIAISVAMAFCYAVERDPLTGLHRMCLEMPCYFGRPFLVINKHVSVTDIITIMKPHAPEVSHTRLHI